ncbi:MAG: Gfo/Idh/MocA family oxidoreductase [Planctomycetota bacterium]|nr:Gfo/Idh/MocA family oxidoreductase [Planctomycetota bacterium]
MTSNVSRRAFLKLSAGSAAAAAAVACQGVPGADGRKSGGNGRLRHGAVGVGGMGGADLKEISKHEKVDVICLCDVDAGRLKAAGELHPGARLYADWREMLEAEGDNLDSLCVSTPDHMHAPVTMAGLMRGLHVYCQKPLTHTVVEARVIREAAQDVGVVTQMGIQNRSNTHYLTAKELFETGVTGPVKSMHVWTDRPAGWWPQDVERPEGSDAIPAELAWNLWLGVAPSRPFKEGAYHGFVWRGRKDFGTGAQGDMACHLMDPALWFPGLGDPLTVRSEGPKPNGESFPLWSRVHYTFPPTASTSKSGVDLTWYDGARKPDELLKSLGIEDAYANACLFVGEKATLLVSPYEPVRLFLPGVGEKVLKLKAVPAVNHWHQWVDACLGSGQTTAGFDYAGLLSEVALLGNVALEFPGENLTWDANEMKFPNQPKANAHLHKTYRQGWRSSGIC